MELLPDNVVALAHPRFQAVLVVRFLKQAKSLVSRNEAEKWLRPEEGRDGRPKLLFGSLPVPVEEEMDESKHRVRAGE